MKNGILTSIVFVIAINALAQIEYSSFTNTGRGAVTTFATDYHALGINPANLGWNWDFENKRFSLGTSEFAYSIHSQALTKTELRNMIKDIIQGNDNKFTYDQKMQAAKDFAQTGFAINADMASFGFCFSTEKFGGIAFRINNRFHWYSNLGETASQLLFQGFNAPYFDSLLYFNGTDTITIPNGKYSPDTLQNVLSGFANIPKSIGEVFNNSQINMSWTREWNLSYGRKIFNIDSVFSLYAGAGIKLYQGLALIEAQSTNNQLSAFSSITPAFGIDYGTAAQQNPSAITQNGWFPKPVGKGWGFDFGINAVLFNKFKIGVSYINAGSITWDGNVYTAQDTLLYDTQNPGLESYNIASQMGDVFGQNGLFKWQGVESKKVSLPSTIRIGAGLRINKKIEIGADVVLPGNTTPGNYENAILAFGGDVMPVKWLRLSAGFVTGGNYDFRIPLGVTFVAKNGTWEGGIASRDAVTFFTQNGPTLSLAMGFLRYRF
jgi:hypothetical protein